MQIAIGQWCGRLCNNITQICHAYHLAKKTGAMLCLPPHQDLQTHSLMAFFNSVPLCAGEPKVVDNFFFTRHPLFITHPISNQERRDILKEVVPILLGTALPSACSSYDLVIHIRSGDVFSKRKNRNAKVHPRFVQPPLSYYKKIITEGGYQSVQIISENTLNPCIEALLRWDNCIGYEPQSISDDVMSILKAKHLVIGYGTFGFVWALASLNLKRLYSLLVPAFVYGELSDGQLKETEFRLFDIKSYIGVGDWACSEEQLHLMLSHSENDICCY